MERTLVAIRHAKSDWSRAVGDRDRPLAPRGRRQAPAIGEWLAGNDIVPDAVLVSPATRAMQTWECVSGAMAARRSSPPPEAVAVDESVYTFDGSDLVEALRGVAPDARVVAVVGHNPAMEELVSALTGRLVSMKTSCLALISFDGEWNDLDRFGRGLPEPRLLAAGRPADGPL